jgi:spore maturation protein CgeB
MSRPLDIVVLGLTLSSSWGNGHATTYRALLGGLDRLGHRVLFLERDKPWYAASRDLPRPGFCELALYDSLAALRRRFSAAIRRADAVIVGSYVPDGVAVLDFTLATASGPVAFYDIDTPITLSALTRGQETYIAPRQIPRLDAYFSFTGGPTLASIERAFGARRALPLHCSVDEARYRPTGGPRRYDLGYLGTHSPDRQPALERLLLEPARRLPDRRFVVAGSSYPPEIAWPPNVERLDHVPPEAHAAFYGSQCFTLNCTRADMVRAGWSPSVRLFEAAACGTPVISDRWPGLDDFFRDGYEILVADSSDRVVEMLRDTGPARAEAIAARARATVLRRDTGLARARELEDHLRVLAAPTAQMAAAPGASA